MKSCIKRGNLTPIQPNCLADRRSARDRTIIKGATPDNLEGGPHRRNGKKGGDVRAALSRRLPYPLGGEPKKSEATIFRSLSREV